MTTVRDTIIAYYVLLIVSLHCSRCGWLTGQETVYSELRGQACTTSESGVSVQSADGFIIEQYSRVS